MADTLNYDKKNWTSPCPKVQCKKNNCGCGCGLKFVSIPASLASEMSPKNGAYSNAIVQYEGTGEVWIYSDEGIPVKIRGANG